MMCWMKPVALCCSFRQSPRRSELVRTHSASALQIQQIAFKRIRDEAAVRSPDRTAHRHVEGRFRSDEIRDGCCDLSSSHDRSSLFESEATAQPPCTVLVGVQLQHRSLELPGSPTWRQHEVEGLVQRLSFRCDVAGQLAEIAGRFQAEPATIRIGVLRG